jgi:lysozyme
MTISQKGLEIIKRHEGLKLEAYMCPAGVWTLGYGTTKGIVQGMSCTIKAAEAMMERDVSYFAAKVADLVKVPTTQSQFDALVSFAYNVGSKAFADSTLLAKLNAGDEDGAAAEFLRWIKGGGKVLPGLIKRRREERDLFIS